MRHAILGAGGVGGLVGAALARGGADVVLLLRPETLAQHPERLRVESDALGDFEVNVATASALDREVDVLWVTVKAPGLEEALGLAPAERVGEAVVMPLLNGVDHIAVLHARYARVLAGAFRGETERVEPGVVRQRWQLARVDLAPGPRRDEIANEVRATGLDVAFAADEETLLWEKLAFLAPLALTTTARGAPVGTVQHEREWKERLMGCHDETVAVGLAEGASLDVARLRAAMDFDGGELRTSMQKDFDAGRPLELDAIGGPIARGGRTHGIATPATDELVRLVEARVSKRETRVTV
jgi:2-dehydropantoate 2-reductase